MAVLSTTRIYDYERKCRRNIVPVFILCYKFMYYMIKCSPMHMAWSCAKMSVNYIVISCGEFPVLVNSFRLFMDFRSELRVYMTPVTILLYYTVWSPFCCTHHIVRNFELRVIFEKRGLYETVNYWESYHTLSLYSLDVLLLNCVRAQKNEQDGLINPNTS